MLVFTYFNRVKKLSSEIEKLGEFEQGDKPTEVLHIDNSSSILSSILAAMIIPLSSITF